MVYCKEEDILFLMRNFVDSKWEWEWCRMYIEEYTKEYTEEYNGYSKDWIALSFADPLKKVCSVLFNYSYRILLGEEYRDERETYKSIEYDICGRLTGREILKYFGSQIMRNNFDENIWVNILKNKVNILKTSKNILITDIRHENERNMLTEMGGILYLVIRNINNSDESYRMIYNTGDVNYLRKQLISLDMIKI